MKGVAVLALFGAAYLVWSNQSQSVSTGTSTDTSGWDDSSPLPDSSNPDDIDFGDGNSVWDSISSAVQQIWTPTVDKQTLSNPNLQAFFQMIRSGEGTLGTSGYTELYGGGHFSSYAAHPNITVTAGSYTSTAAGAYQILYSTWKTMQAKYPSVLTDFSPANQDFCAMALIANRGALNDVINGNFQAAILACNKEWASLPLSPYGQPTMTMDRALQIIAANGGTQVA